MLKQKVEDMLAQSFPEEKVVVTVDERSLAYLSGEISSWQTLIDIGHAVAKVPGIRNVISYMKVKNLKIPTKDYAAICEKGKAKGVIEEADVVIVGAGITGCGVARELSKYDLKTVVVERGDDVSSGSSKCNNGCIHHGMDCKPGTLKTKLNILGNRRYSDWDRELHINLNRCGALEIATKIEDMPKLYERFEKGLKNGTDGIQMIDKTRAYKLEPALEKEGVDVFAALYMPSFGVVETPYVCIALAENAAMNKVKFLFEHTVGDIEVIDNKISAVITDKGIIKTKYVVNAAGMFADDIAKMAGDQLYTIHNRRGTIAIFDKSVPPTYNINMLILGGVDKKGKNVESKGGGMHPTPENNLLIGPSAMEVPDKEDTETSWEDMDYVIKGCLQDPHNPKSNIIKIFGGARPADFKEDFTVEMSEIIDGFVHAACIQSPGVAAAPAVADLVVDLILQDCKEKGKTVTVKKDYNPYRDKPVEFRHMTREEQAALIEKDPRYGRIVCRCEHVTEGEIVDALKSPVIPTSITAIKNRTRAGMGRCQGGFCQPRVLEIIAREHGKEWTDINLRGTGSNILDKNSREGEA